MNVVALLGNAATTPELRRTSGGRAVTNFRIAIDRPGSNEADFVRVVAWERQAEIVNEYVAVGSRLSIEGRLRQTTWETDGVKHSEVEVVAHRVQLLSRRPQKDAAPAPEAVEAVA